MVPHDAIEAAGTDAEDSGGGEFEPIELTLDSASSRHFSSAAHKHAYENGRRYHYFRNGKYPIPNDDKEQEREDMKHALVMELTDGRLVHAPIGDHPRKIIDMGTGTGIWAIEDRYPEAEVVGVDLSPMQPAWVPPNVRFHIDDVEDEWIVNGPKYDYAHMRNLLSFVDKVPRFLAQCYENLQPGGWIESGDFNGDTHCDDGTMPDDWPVKVFFDRLDEALRRMHSGSSREFRIAPRVGAALEAAGFVHVACRVYKAPIGTWPADKTLRLVGMYMRHAIGTFLDAAAVGPLKAGLGMSDADIAAFVPTVADALRNRSVHAYNKFYVWTAQKPLDAQP